MSAKLPLVFLFTDIEGSTRLWEQQPERMRAALAAHDAIVDAAVARHGGQLVKRTGDGVHAAFGDALSAVHAMLDLQRALADPQHTAGLPLAVRCGTHAGADEARDNDFYGPDVNRAARIMAAAHGGQMLLSQAVVDGLGGRVPPGAELEPLGRVRLRDLLRPEPLYQLVAPPLRSRFPPLRSLEATPNNLGTQVSRFIGRSQALRDVRQLLADNRLVTLFGPGGIGKTRLSMQLAAELLDDHPDGVWFIELAPLAGGAEAHWRVPQAVASTLGLKEQPGQPLLDTLAEYLAGLRLLLVLDNCEHVLDASAAMAKRLLAAAAGLRILASSRELLRVGGEAVFAVPALSLPQPVGPQAAAAAHAGTGQSDVALADQLLQHEAVRLFVDRALLCRPDFRLDAHNAAAVAEICHRVDGIPLAIELAAARVRALPVQSLAERLRDSFRLLATRDQTVAPRQRTLAHLIDWSHDMLSPAERVLYRRLSVFAGGFSLPAAEAVCGGDDCLPADQVLDLLSLLVEKSLLVPVEGAPGAEGRWRMLETVRQHAAEQLQQAEGAARAVRRRQSAYCRDLTTQAARQLAGPQQAEWLARLDTEGENLLAVLAWCAEPQPATAARRPGEPALPSSAVSVDPAEPIEPPVVDGLAIAFALRPYWINRGLLSLALDTVLALLRNPDAHRRDQAQARGLFAAGQLCTFMGRHAQAVEHLSQSLDILRQCGDEQGVLVVLQPLGIAAIGLGDIAGARRHFEAAELAARKGGRLHQLAGAVNAVAQVDRMEGLLDAAHARYSEFLKLARQLGDAEYEAVALLNLAMVAVARGDGRGVPAMLLQVMRRVDDNGSRPLALGALDACAGLAALSADWPRVALCAGLAESQKRLAGLARDAADQAFIEPVLAAARGALGEPAYQAAEQAALAIAFEPAWHSLQAWLGLQQAEGRGFSPSC